MDLHLCGVMFLAGALLASGCQPTPDASPGGTDAMSNDGPDALLPCDDRDRDGVCTPDEDRRGLDPDDPDTDDDGIPDGVEIDLGTDPLSPDGACGDATGAVTPVSRAADLVLVVDSSGSMSEENVAIEAALNEGLVAPLESAGVDYRVTMFARFPCPATSSPTICIDQPPGAETPVQDCAALRASGCDSSVLPVNNERFHHANAFVGSNRLFDMLVYAHSDVNGAATGYGDDATLNGNLRGEAQLPGGWSSRLRPGSNRVFILVGDDDAASTVASTPALWSTATAFHGGLISVGPDLGTPTSAYYAAHLIGGMAANSARPDGVWHPEDPVVAAECPDADSAGPEYQAAAIFSQGLRLPICDASTIPRLLQRVAGEIVGSVSIPCRFELEIPDDETPDLSRVAVVHWLDDLTFEILNRVGSAGECTGGGYYVTEGETPGIELCPLTCTEITESAQTHPEARLRAHVACQPPIVY